MSLRKSSRRLLAVLRLTFVGPANASAWNWWPLVVWTAGLFLSFFGTAIPKLSLSHSAWIMIFLGITVLLLLRTAYELHAKAYPDFPAHVFTPGPLWALSHPSPPNPHETELIVFDVDFTNRQAAAKVHLSVDLYWIHDMQVRSKRRLWFDRKRKPWGPHRVSPFRGSLGTNTMLDRPAVVGPHDPINGLVAFGALPIPGLKIEGNDLIAADYLRFVVRLRDDISGAETDDLPVRLLGATQP